MCVRNESPCILVYYMLCHVQTIRLGRTYGPLVLVTYTKQFCTRVGNVTLSILLSLSSHTHTPTNTHTKTRLNWTYLVVPNFFFSKNPQFNIIVITIVIIHSLTTFNWNPWLIFGSVLTWHSYVPESLICGDVILSVHSSDPSECSDWKRWSFV